MTKLRVQRVNYINQWQLDVECLDSIFPAERELIERIRSSQTSYFEPVMLTHSNNDRYHYYLNFIVESLELLPLKVDLAFDTCWKGFESLLFEHSVNWKKAHEVLSSYAIDYECAQCSQYSDGKAMIARLMNAIPVQTCEYISLKLLNSDQESKQIIDRLAWKNNNAKFLTLLSEMKQKYGAPNLSPSDRRKSALLLRKVFQGENIKVGSFEDSLSLTERFSLLLLGVLYTFRNDRFHGGVQPPFKSSVAKLRTYAHAHFCFLATYHIFVQSLENSKWAKTNHSKTAIILLRNINYFEQLYGRHLHK